MRTPPTLSLPKRTLAVVFVLGLVVGGAATAVAGGRANDPEALPEAPIVQASAPGARVAALVGPGGTLVRKRGVASVTNPATGTYCVAVKASTRVDVERVVAQATVEWGRSSGSANLVQVYAGAPDCDAGAIEVLTFGDTGTGFEPSNSVAFNLMVP